MVKHYLISGRVQGVGYRAFVARTCKGLEMKGWVRNMVDGRVELIARGSKELHAKLEEALHRGPLLSKVESVYGRIVETTDVWDDFNIDRRDGVTEWSLKNS